ncbi:hypothetical protein BD289DRAFT_342708, partial [Coniella lustricola]
NKKIAEFPDVEAKLQKPTKQSAFERQKAEAEAKRLREAAETAAVYEDFVKSFDADSSSSGGGRGGRDPNRQAGFAGGRTAGGLPSSRGGGAIGGINVGGGGGRRHFGGAAGLGGMKSSGPGTLGPAQPGYGKKRGFESFAAGGNTYYNNNSNSSSSRRDHSADMDDEQQARTGYGSGVGGGGGTASSRAEEQAIAKPTLRLANLPPATSPAVIKALLGPTNLAVEGVKILAPATGTQQQQQPPQPQPQGPTTERKSIAAIVTLSAETAASDLDAAVSALQHRYLGFGYYLSLHRHLSSAAIAMASEAAIIAGSAAGPSSHPFGAKPVAHGPGSGHGPVAADRGGGRFAPPSSYSHTAGASVNSRNLLHVPVQPPRDIKQLRMIHKVIESVLQHGPEFEALLMSRPDVQREERWAWIWDARSQGGVWYRWRLWEIVTGARKSGGGGKYLPIFEGSHAWRAPEKELAFEYTTGVDEFVSDSEYDSEFDDDDENDGEAKITMDGGNHHTKKEAEEEVFLNPMEKAKLVHLLARLPTTLSKIRKGDIARITAFAILHSNRGADEVVDLVVSNLEKPLAYTAANPAYRRENEGGEEAAVAAVVVDGAEREGAHPTTATTTATTTTATTTATTTTTTNTSSAPDTSGSKLVALYVISDILSSSSTSGIRHAWRYRQLLEAALKARRVFEGLGALPERLSWGRLRAEKWKRSIGLVLNLWDGWCVFPNDSQELFVRSFENPPPLAVGDGREDGENSNGKREREEKERAERTRWKTVEAASASAAASAGGGGGDAGAAGGADEDGSWDEYTDDEELDNELLAHHHIDGESLLEIDIVGLALGDVDGDVVMAAAPKPPRPGSTEPGHGSSGGFSIPKTARKAGQRKRMTAADMFADSDSGED